MTGCTCGHGANYHGEQGCAKLNGHDEYCDCPFVPPDVTQRRVDTIVKAKHCNTHPSYRGSNQPKSPCENCWRLWIALNPRTP